MKKFLFISFKKCIFTTFYLGPLSTPPPPLACRFEKGSEHFDGRWYFCLRAQGPGVDSRPLVLVAPHSGQTIMHTN